jgi:hypothetical protein
VDRVYLALGQQNGITAVILALALQPVLPYAVSVVAPAILAVNILNIASNGVWDNRARIARWYHGPVPAASAPPAPAWSRAKPVRFPVPVPVASARHPSTGPVPSAARRRPATETGPHGQPI